MNQTAMTDSLQIYTDGGSRGNPGPAACSYTARMLKSQLVISENSLFLGQATNNVAEYRGIILALEWLAEQPSNFVTDVEFFSDSQLVVNQIKGTYRIKDVNLYALFTQLSQLLTKIQQANKVRFLFTYIPRENNKRADELVNITLDSVLR